MTKHRQTLYITKGLPASGKSTEAIAMVQASKGKLKRVNKDDLRAMIDGGSWSKQKEAGILRARDALINSYLVAGFDVIVDDTNLHPKHEEAIRNIAKRYDASVEILDFTDVPLKTCLERDRKRGEKAVGDRVITGMWEQFLKPKIEVNKSLPWCIICDIDGTLADHTGIRSPFDESKVLNDKAIVPVYEIVESFLYNFDNHKLIFFSGRTDGCREDTEKWLNMMFKSFHNNIDYQLYMRKSGDNRPDYIIKRELYENHIKDNYNIKFVIDDRLQVAYMWYELGIFVINVNQGLVDF